MIIICPCTLHHARHVFDDFDAARARKNSQQAILQANGLGIRIGGIQMSWFHTTDKPPREKTLGEILLINQLVSKEGLQSFI